MANLVKKEDSKVKREERKLSPASEIIETKEEFIINLEIPGVEKKDVDINVEAEYLDVNAKSSYEDNFDVKEFKIYDYYRRFVLGAKIQRDKIKAALENGVLTLTLPKAEELKAKKIAISS